MGKRLSVICVINKVYGKNSFNRKIEEETEIFNPDSTALLALRS